MNLKILLKGVYSAIPFKQSLFTIVKKKWQLPHSIYCHLHFKGVFKVNVSKSESFKIMHYGYEIENELFWKGVEGGWEKVSSNLWIQLCRRANVIVDIGANTGVYALLAKAVNPDAKIFAFEPVERVYQKLLKNCQLNSFSILCLKKAASNYTGKAIIYDPNDEHVYSVTVNKNTRDLNVDVNQTEIDTLTLAQFIEDYKLNNIDLLKIDVETHEPEVLEGFGSYLQKFKPSILIEVLNDEVGHKVQSLVEGLDYLYFNIDENNGIRLVSKIEHSDYYNYLLCTKSVALELGLLKGVVSNETLVN